MGGKTSTSTQSVSIPPEVLARYNAVNARAEQTAGQPFQRYDGSFVAPITGTQQAGIDTTRAAAGAAQPYYQAAAGLTAAGAGTAAPGELETQRYMSPYTQNVVDTTRRALEQQQGTQLAEQQAAQIRGGAFGGDRAGIQRAVLQGQQGLATAQAISPLYQQGYGQALQTAQQQQGVGLQARQADLQRALAAGQQFGQLGTGAQTAGLAAGQALLGAGTLEQQTQQADMSARYQQFLQERGYPFQVAQFLANIAMGTGALSGSTTTTTQPAPFFSDEREKTNIKPLGKGLYAYDYKDDVEAAEREGRPMPPKRVGPMAQDIERTRPGLVVDVNDYKVVDPSRDSMGGAVVQPGAYERGGYADGGLAEILAQQRAMFGGLGGGQGGVGQGGTPYGGLPGVPAGPVQVRELIKASPLPQQRPSGLAEAAQTGSQIADLVKMGSSAYDWGKKKWQESGKPDDVGREVPEKADDPMNRATGGLVPQHYAAGGSMNTAALPYKTDDDYFPEQILDTQKIEPLKPADPPRQQGGGGLGEIIGIGARILPFFLASGGLVPRHAYAEGGAPNYDDLIAAAAEKHNVPVPLLRALFQQESGGNTMAIGKAGEAGLGQIKASTARDPGYGVTPVDPRDLTKEAVNIPFSAEYLAKKAAHMGYKDLSDPENQRQALMLYNAGSGREKYADEVLARMPGLAGAATERAPAAARPVGLAGGVDTLPMARVTPGLAGPGYVEDTPRASPFKFFAGKALSGRGIEPETKEALTSENLWLPVLAGVGSMLASRSPYLGGAIGEGLAGGTKAYTDLAKQQQEMGKSRVESEKILADLAHGAFSEAGGILRVRVVDPRTGQYRLMSNAEWLSLPSDKRPPIDPRVPRDVLERWTKGGSAAPGTAPTTQPVGATAVPRPGKIDVPPLPPSSEKPPIVRPKVEPAIEPAQAQGAIAFNPKDAEQAHKEAVQIANLSTVARADLQKNDMFIPQAAVATSSQQAKMSLLPLATTIMALPEGQSLGTSGPFSETISPYLQTLQNLAEMATGKKGIVIDPAVLANQEEARKLIKRMEAETTTQSGQTAVEAMKRISEGIVNLSQSKTGQKQILANVLAQTQRQIDKDKYFSEWQRAASTAPGGEEGAFREYARLSSIPASRKFDKDYGRAFYDQEEKRLLSMMNTRVKNPEDSAKPMSVFEFVAKYGQRMSPDDLAQIKTKYGEGVTRYFGF